MRARAGALVADALCVLLFALLGRVSHEEGVTPGGLAQTAWPFLAALALGWVVVRATLGGWPTKMWHTVPVWLCTAFGGMAFRAGSDQGTAVSFVVVAVLVLGLLMFGWRAAVEVARFATGGLARWSRDARAASGRRP